MESHHMHTWIPVGIALILVAGCGRTTSMKRDDVDAGLAGTQSDANTDRGDIEGLDVGTPMDVTVSDARIADAEPLDLDTGMAMFTGDQWGRYARCGCLRPKRWRRTRGLPTVWTHRHKLWLAFARYYAR